MYIECFFLVFLITFLPTFTYEKEKQGKKEPIHFFKRDIPDHYGRVILISGLTSCGKSSTSGALQKLLAQNNEPFIVLGMDDFLKSLPQEWIDLDSSNEVKEKKKEGVSFQKVAKTKKEIEEEKAASEKFYQEPLTHKYVPVIGELVQDLLKALSKAARSFSEQGINVIFEGGLPLYGMKADLWERKPYLFLISCPLHVAEEREFKRGGFKGLARGMSSFDFEKDVDLIVDSTKVTPEQAAKKILEYMQKSPAKAPEFLFEDIEAQKLRRKEDVMEALESTNTIQQEYNFHQQKKQLEINKKLQEGIREKNTLEQRKQRKKIAEQEKTIRLKLEAQQERIQKQNEKHKQTVKEEEDQE